MKILILSAYLPGKGLHGGSSRIYEILHYLHLYHDITLLTFRGEEDDESKVTQLNKMCTKVEIFPKNKKHSFYLFPYDPYIDYRSKNFSDVLKKVLKKNHFDIVQYEYAQMGIYNEHTRGIPSVLTEHEVSFLAFQNRVPFVKNWLFKIKAYYDSLQMMKMELEVLRTMDRVICMNHADENSLKGYINDKKLKVIPHGVDTNYFKPDENIEVDPLGLGFFGSYKHYPNVDAVLHFVNDIFPLIKREHPTSHFYIIGANPSEEILKFRDRPDITVTGFVDDIRPYLARCSVIVVPVRLGLGMRVKVLEAMAMGKPVVGTELALEGADVLDGKHAIVANSDESFADSVCYLLQDRQCAERLGEEARIHVEENFHYKKIGRMIENVYLELLSRG